MDLGNRIKTEREKLNMSQDDLAQKMDISRQAISKWETGSSYNFRIRIDCIRRYYMYLGGAENTPLN